MFKLFAFSLIGGLATLTLATPALAAHGHLGGAPGRRSAAPLASPAGHDPVALRPHSAGGPRNQSTREDYGTWIGYRGVSYGVAAGGSLPDEEGFGGDSGFYPGYGDAGYQTYPVVQAYDPNGWEVYGGSYLGAGRAPQSNATPVSYVQAPPPGAYANSAYVETPGPADHIYVSAPYVQEAVAGQAVYLSAPFAEASPSCGRWTWSNGVVTYAWVAC